ncbi:hypothetical protein FG386_000403 [Cryptosporidium ryanae]|uniref:uncharacterized protein n=1 Tax=Cryptosporidium ryanae TaxID=515981 RepID=UPI00351A69E0|nr:hypothetical protein FG386_000403 [Cryptosporidium ryanae]
MDCKNKLKTAKKRIIDILLKLSDDEEILRQTAIINVGVILKEIKECEALGDLKNILIEILMNIIIYSSVNKRVKDLNKFISEVPEISNLSDHTRLQSMNTLLESQCYSEIDIFRRLLGCTIQGSKSDIKKSVIPGIVFRPLFGAIVSSCRNDQQLLLEMVNFLYSSTHCINIYIEKCFKLNEYNLLVEILIKLFPVVDNHTRIEIFTSIHINLLKYDIEIASDNSDLSDKAQYLILLLLINTNFQCSLLITLIPMISQLKMKKKFSTLLLLFVLLTLVKIFEGSELTSNISDSVELLNTLKFILKSGGIAELKSEQIFNIINLIVITMSILLLKTIDIDEFSIISEIITIITSEVEEVNTLPFISSLIYHIKGDLVKDNYLCNKSKCILFELFGINKLEDLSDIRINVHDLFTVSEYEINNEINNLLKRHSFFNLVGEDILIYLKSCIYNSLYIAFRFIQQQKNIESRSFDMNINDEVYYYAVGCTILKYYLGNSNELNNLLKKIITNEYNHQIKLFDFIFPAYDFLLRKFEHDKNHNNFSISICDSLVSFGNNKNILPIVYNRVRKNNNYSEQILRNEYLLFVKGELSFSKLEDDLVNQIDSELSEFRTDQLINNMKGFRILFCILRFKPDIINEIFIQKLQQGLKSTNKYVVSASLHCLIELCKFGVFDYDKTIRILFGLHSNVLITEISYNDITPLEAINYQSFGLTYKHFPIEVLSSFIRLFNAYLCENWPSEKNFYKKVPNNVFYILILIVQIIRDNYDLISIYSLNIISNLFQEYFYQNNKFDENFHYFIVWCINNCFNLEINNLFHLVELLDSFISMRNIDLEINNLNFITENISGPIKSILNFELEHEIYNSKKYSSINYNSSLFNINIKIQFNYDNRSTVGLVNNSNIDESRGIIKSKLLLLYKKVSHNYCIQEILNFLLYDVKQLRIDVIRNSDKIEIDLFRLRFLNDIFKIIKNIKLLVSTIFQLQIMFQFVNIFKEYINQLDFIALELIPRSKNRKTILNIDNEILLLFYFFLSYLPSFKDMDEMIKNHLDIVEKVFEIRENERQFSDELFIENQSILIIMLSGLVILRHDLLNDKYEEYILNMFNIEILPNKLFCSFFNCEVFIKRYFSKKTTLIDQFIVQNNENENKTGSYIVFCDQTYYVNKEISTIEFICTLLRYTYQNSKENYEITLKKYFILQAQEPIKIYSKYDNTSAEIFLLSDENLIHNYCFGIFSFIDIIFDNFSENDEILNRILYYQTLQESKTELNVVNLVFQTVCLVKLFYFNVINIDKLFLFVDENFLMKNEYFECEDNDKNMGILIKLFCFSYIYYNVNNLNDSKHNLRSDQINRLNEHSLIIMNTIKYYISTKFFENNYNNEIQYYIISATLLIKGFYWVPWSLFLNKNLFVNIDTLNELCGFIYKNQITSLKKENNKILNDKYSNIDLLMIKCINDPIKISISTLFLFSQINNLSNSLENKNNIHNRDNYFEIKMLNKNSLLFAVIYKLDISIKNIISIISNNYFENEPYDKTLIRELIFIGIILNSLGSCNICSHFTNFNISDKLESLLFKIIIPLIKSKEFKLNNDRLLDWLVLKLTNFISLYLHSNNSFSSILIYFGNCIIDYLIKNSQENKIIMLSFTRLIGTVVLTFDSDIHLLINFITNFFNKLLKLRNFELFIVSGLTSFIEIFKINIEKRRYSSIIKLNNVIIKLLNEITFNNVVISNNVICNSLKLLVTLLYNCLYQINSNELKHFTSNINPLIFSKLILEYKISVDVLHDYYLNMSIEPNIQEIILLVNIYKLCIKQSVSYENQILNFLYLDLKNSIKASKKQILTITILLSFLLLENFEQVLISNLSADKLKYFSVGSEINVDNWDDIRNFFFLDKANDPIVENWEKNFLNDDGIVFLSNNYYSIKEFPQVSIDTNHYYGNEFLSWNLCNYPEILLKRVVTENKSDWRNLSSRLFRSSMCIVDSSESKSQEFQKKQIIQILYILLIRVERDTRTKYNQYKNELLKIIKELEKQ